MKKYYFGIHERGLETVAIWQHFMPALKVGEFHLASHSADVNLLTDHIMQKMEADVTWKLTRIARNGSADFLNGICQRLCGLVESTLPGDDEFRTLVRGVRAVTSQAHEAVPERTRQAIVMWKKFNAHRAAMQPPQPELVIDDVTVTALQSNYANHGQLLGHVDDKDSAHSGLNSQLRRTATRVDKNNKRWFKAWRSSFATGTPEREALSRVSTENSTSLPGQAVFLKFELLPDRTVRLFFGAARARGFTLLHKGPGANAFSVLVDGLTATSFEHTTGETGEHEYKLVPHNNSGDGAESLVLKVQVAQQQVA